MSSDEDDGASSSEDYYSDDKLYDEDGLDNYTVLVDHGNSGGDIDSSNNNNNNSSGSGQGIMNEHIAQTIQSTMWTYQKISSTNQAVFQREINSKCPFSVHDKVRITQGLIPANGSMRFQYDHQVFCGQYSQDGSVFMSACQDRHIRLYETETWKPTKDILAKNIGWSIIDTDYSPDQRWLIYSSWSEFVHFCNIHGDFEIHDALDFSYVTRELHKLTYTRPESERFCLFSIKFSPDSNEILGGSSDRHLYIYDLNRKERTVRVEAHDDDINTVCFMDSLGHLIVSGSDDQMVKVWDRRLLGAAGYGTGCVGLLPGHSQGITHVSPKGDGRYVISNGKDQSIKLWDLRTMVTPLARKSTGSRRNVWDYRSGLMGIPQVLGQNGRSHPNDHSLMTYRGHRVLQTLIRSYFSPVYSTGQKCILHWLQNLVHESYT